MDTGSNVEYKHAPTSHWSTASPRSRLMPKSVLMLPFAAALVLVAPSHAMAQQTASGLDGRCTVTVQVPPAQPAGGGRGPAAGGARGGAAGARGAAPVGGGGAP